ncbi:helix-turn-helix domain-containing protein [Polynucleobacter sp. JS-Safj-400b-B2]|uniref:helix-turn-helix domain-containing protein n=1 Tax=Polynucleobacter sp. JS-Safj-400b-B2 TaxID=2576921 RepID=UPI00210303A2|nr:helix-turn-helix transcriptional regulator [Polynucleobacter sp. JS-Safj-400b-B2]
MKKTPSAKRAQTAHLQVPSTPKAALKPGNRAQKTVKIPPVRPVARSVEEKVSTQRKKGQRGGSGRPKRSPGDGQAVPSAERLMFARNLRRSRRWLEISQEEMALRSGMSRSYVSGVELGERNISVDNMARLAAVLGLPLHQLLDPGYVPDSALRSKVYR